MTEIPTCLKPSLSVPIAMLVSGVVLLGIFAWGAFILIRHEAHYIAAYAGIAVFSTLMVLWIRAALQALRNRNRAVIRIDRTGVSVCDDTVEPPDRATFIPVEEIVRIRKDESMAGRLIAIDLRDGRTGFIQARNYCSLDKFLRICKEHGLPV